VGRMSAGRVTIPNDVTTPVAAPTHTTSIDQGLAPRTRLMSTDPGGGLTPPYPGGGVASRGALEDTSRSNAKQQLTFAAFDALVPIIYGEVRPSALLANALVNGSNWVFWLIWCEGECDSVT